MKRELLIILFWATVLSIGTGLTARSAHALGSSERSDLVQTYCGDIQPDSDGMLSCLWPVPPRISTQWSNDALKQKFISEGAQFPPGSVFLADPQMGQILVRSTLKDLRVMEAVYLKSGGWVQWPSLIETDVQFVRLLASDQADSAGALTNATSNRCRIIDRIAVTATDGATASATSLGGQVTAPGCRTTLTVTATASPKELVAELRIDWRYLTPAATTFPGESESETDRWVRKTLTVREGEPAIVPVTVAGDKNGAGTEFLVIRILWLDPAGQTSNEARSSRRTD